MPKYKIIEEDNTGLVASSEQPNIVYIPGAIASGLKSEPKLYTSVSKFIADEAMYKKDTSYLMAKRLLSLGMQVLYQGFTSTSSTTSISDNKFSISPAEIEYTINGSVIDYIDPITGSSVSAEIDEYNTASLYEGVKVHIGDSVVTYPVNVVTNSANIYEDSDVKKFEIDGVIYTLGENTITPEDGESIDVNNGVAEIGNAISGTKITMSIDYLHSVVVYTRMAKLSNDIAINKEDWEVLEDKDMYNIRFLTTGGYEILYPIDMAKVAANRGDCVALVTHSKSYNTKSVADIRTYFESFAGAVKSTAHYENWKHADPLSCISAFTPWFKAKITDSSDVVTEVPATFGYLLAYARSIQTNPLWKSVAGVHRGVISELVDVCRKYTSAECEVLQARASTGEVDLDDTNDNVGIAINPICYKRYSGFNGGFNYVLNGNRTMHDNASITTSDGKEIGNLIATSFLNVRMLLTEISKTLYDASIAHTFEQNNEVLWFNFRAMVTPLLDRMQSGEGIAGYRLERLATDKKARLVAKLTIVPVEAVEDFELTIALEDSIEVSE